MLPIANEATHIFPKLKQEIKNDFTQFENAAEILNLVNSHDKGEVAVITGSEESKMQQKLQLLQAINNK